MNAISICTDIWTDNQRHNSFLDVTVVFLNKNLELKHAAIAFSHFNQSHTGDNINYKISDVLGKFKIDPQKVTFVTDSASNMRKAFQNFKWVPCFAHRLNTCVEDAFTELQTIDDEIRNLWNQMINIRSYINKSSDKSDLLTKKIPVGSITRPWSGYFNFLKAFDSSYDEISMIASEKKLIMPTNHPLIKLLLKTFEHFEPLFKKLQTIDEPSIHFVIVEVFRLKLNLEKMPVKKGVDSIMIQFRDIIIKSIEKKYI